MWVSSSQKKHYSWLPKLLVITNSSELKGLFPLYTQAKAKSRFEALLGELHKFAKIYNGIVHLLVNSSQLHGVRFF